MPSTISDHFHVILSRSTIKQKYKNLESLYRPISDENIERTAFKLKLEHRSIINDPNYVSDQFLKTIQTSSENTCPVKTPKKVQEIIKI